MDPFKYIEAVLGGPAVQMPSRRRQKQFDSEIKRYRTAACRRLKMNPDTASDGDLFPSDPNRFLNLVMECVVDTAQTRMDEGNRPNSANTIDVFVHFLKLHYTLSLKHTVPEDWDTMFTAPKERLVEDNLLNKEKFNRSKLTIDDVIFLIEEDTMARITPSGWIGLEANGGNMMGLYLLAFLFGVQCGIRPSSLWGATIEGK